MSDAARRLALLTLLTTWIGGARSQQREWQAAQQAASAGDSKRMLHFASAALAKSPDFAPAAVLRVPSRCPA